MGRDSDVGMVQRIIELREKVKKAKRRKGKVSKEELKELKDLELAYASRRCSVEVVWATAGSIDDN